jgi:hypothetical protein
MKFVNLLAVVLTTISAPAFAGGAGISFDEIREACQSPGKFQNQIAPTNLQVTCEERASRWLPYTAKEMTLPRSRQITASLSSDKYQVSPSVHEMDIEMQTASCPSFKEVIEISSFTKATTCDEILQFKGGVEEYCAEILDHARQSNPKMVQINDTGRVVEFCAGDNGQQQKPGRDQGKGQGKGQGK